MKAVGYYKNLPVSAPESLIDIEIDKPTPGPHDLLVKVQAISVNPADVKLRAGSPPTAGQARILGYDAVGTVEAVGARVSLFRPGDEVFYAGAINRPGTYAEYHTVDERVVGLKPKTISAEQAAALPLTSLTAWELLFDRLGVPYGRKDRNDAILIVNGAGGVGSILTQLARRLTGLTVIATASRPETIAWVKELGAHHVIDHHKPLDQGLKELGIPNVRYVAGLTATDKHQNAIIEALKPHGALAMIDDPETFDIVPFKRKSLSVHWELMFTPTLYATPDIAEQHRILTEIAALVDSRVIRSTLQENYGTINAENLKRAHTTLESGRGMGKIVLSGF
ncbi:zinc-binding alcohol dehydrogenase family protein [Rhizobium laguerreae]|uniref:Zinc-type alcohol dehydrogenase-like protein n=1 Tax=Rhizobium laguerreae TaxID=1076926 RepID=A0AB35FD47_9HYPH|nr:zinc-binding alcohol dehydrogenase family protein [Rhizobium laguerreae]MBY3064558.1 zinc-binding alcohol dehydrogenase family protein [Rhizobium laguerreae]